MNTLEAMKNTGETETVLFHGKGSLAPPRRALLLLLSHTRHVHFLRAACRQQVVYSKCFFQEALLPRGPAWLLLLARGGQREPRAGMFHREPADL